MLTHQNKGEKKNNQLQWEERLPHVHTEIWWDFSLSTFLVFLSKAFLLHKLYHIMLFSSRVPERSHRVTSALFLMVRHLNETTIVLICFFWNFPIFCCPFMYFLLFVAHRYGELVASHPWKAIIACLAITIAGGSGLLRSILEKSNIEYWRNMEEILMTLVWTSQGNIGRKNQLKNKPIIHLFCLGFMKKATQPAWSYQEDRNSEKISTGRMKISQER